MANLLAQRFRYLQKLNDLAIDDVPKTRPITSEQRAILLTAFECKPDLTFDAIRKLLGFDKSVRFNLERGGEKKLPGNRGEIRANCKNRPLRKRVRGTSGELSSGPLRNFRR
jgi:hypothetical protein